MPVEVTMDHLKEVVKKIAAENPPKRTVTRGNFDVDVSVDTSAKLSVVAGGVAKFPCDPAEGEEAPSTCLVPDFEEESLTMFNYVGTGFGPMQTYNILDAVKSFAAKTEGVTKARFWGLIYGTEKDYWVIEGKCGTGEGDPRTEQFEALGTGANTYSYWVCNDINSPEWVRLSETYPEHIMESAGVKKMLTGNLNAKVVSYPWFDKLERTLLRAQIARISSMTMLSVRGYLAQDEDGKTVEAEDFAMPEPEALESPEAWVHCAPHILKGVGRSTYIEIDPEDESKAEELEKLNELKAEEPEQPLLRDLNPETWVVKRKKNVICIKPNEWPGAINCCNGRIFSHLYIGYGFESGESSFFPDVPGAIMDEPEDLVEQPEPWPVEGVGEDEASDGGEEDA